MFVGVSVVVTRDKSQKVASMGQVTTTVFGESKEEVAILLSDNTNPGSGRTNNYYMDANKSAIEMFVGELTHVVHPPSPTLSPIITHTKTPDPGR
jgi:hypothetical protein